MKQRKEKTKKNVDKSYNITRRNKSKDIRRKTQKIPGEHQTTPKQNKTFQNNERKLYLQIGVDTKRTTQQLDAKETKQFWNKISTRKDHNKNVE